MEALNLRFPSSSQRVKYERVLAEFSGSSVVELVNTLSHQLNPRSMEIAFNGILTCELGTSLVEKRRDIPSCLYPLAFSGLKAETSLRILNAIFQQSASEVDRILSELESMAANIAADVDAAEKISDFVNTFGFSKIALKKVLLLAFGSKSLSDSSSRLIDKIFRDGNGANASKEVYFLIESLRPRGKPFAMWFLTNETLELTASHLEEGSILAEGLCPVPTQENHVSSYLCSLVGLSLADQVVGVKALLKVAAHRNWKVYRQAKSLFDQSLLSRLEDEIDAKMQVTVIENAFGGGISDYDIYTAAPAFPEFGNVVLFRNEADRFLLPHLLSGTTFFESPDAKKVSKQLKSDWKAELEDERVSDHTLHFDLSTAISQDLGRLLRFLKYRSYFPLDYDIPGKAISRVLDTKIPAQQFILPKDVEKFSISARYHKDVLGDMIWHSIAIAGRLSDDADYSFLRSLENFAIDAHQGDIVAAFNALKDSYPQLTVELIKLLTPRRLQKCYLLVSSYSEVNAIHRSLLEIAAKITGDLELIMQADQILLDEKLASVRAHIDSSRIYVEEVLYKKWVEENIWPQLEVVSKQIYLIFPGRDRSLTTAEVAAQLRTGAIEKLTDMVQELFLNDQLSKSYETFCCDHYFGVDSFLGRRIRHNATHSLLLGQLDDVCLKTIDQNLQYAWEIKEIYNRWKQVFSAEVDKLVDQNLRFKSEQYPLGLMSKDVDASSDKAKAMSTDVIAQVVIQSSPEVVIRALTSGCWGILDPELRKIREYLKGEFSRNTLDEIDRQFQNSSRPCQVLQRELKSTLLEKIERLSSWFSPYNPSEISLSLDALANLIWAEHESFEPAGELQIEGNALDALVVGGQSRILYDCLHVLLVNAAKHCSGEQNVSLSFDADDLLPGTTTELRVTVKSTLSTEDGDVDISKAKFQKMKKVLQEEDQSKEFMVVQGYSGLRKLRYLLFRMQRDKEISLAWKDSVVEIGFSIPIDIAPEESAVE